MDPRGKLSAPINHPIIVQLIQYACPGQVGVTTSLLFGQGYWIIFRPNKPYGILSFKKLFSFVFLEPF